MSVLSVKISPASGDDKATLFSSPDTNSSPIGEANKGDVFRVVEDTGKFYRVASNPTGENIASGGGGNEGTCIATPYTYLYDNQFRHKSLGRINNGTWITILDIDDETNMYKVECLTTNGKQTGYMEPRYLFRTLIEASPVEGGDS